MRRYTSVYTFLSHATHVSIPLMLFFTLVRFSFELALFLILGALLLYLPSFVAEMITTTTKTKTRSTTTFYGGVKPGDGENTPNAIKEHKTPKKLPF